MSYLKQFLTHLSANDYPSFLALWEEYCLSDQVDPQEFQTLLEEVKKSDLVHPFKRHAEKGISLWKKLPDSPSKDAILTLILDIQDTNTPQLADLTLDYLKERYPNDPYFHEKIRLIGLREQNQFQGAIRNYVLLTHMKKGRFVFHTGGWGVGEIMDISFLREELSLEFDYVSGRKDFSFDNAFRTLIPLNDTHFLARRFGSPDKLEKEAKDDPVGVIRILLRDLGPKTAAEIKEELYELVIPEENWYRWWQIARAKIKKDTLIETPKNLRSPFYLRKREISHEEQLQKTLDNKPDAATLIRLVYSFLRDFPQSIKEEKFRRELEEKLQKGLSIQGISPSEKLQLYFFLEDLGSNPTQEETTELLETIPSPKELIEQMEIIAFKKRALSQMRNTLKNWEEIFLDLFLSVDQGMLRDYMLGEFLSNPDAKKKVECKLEELVSFPTRYPNALLWYFQKVMQNSSLPLSDQKGKNRLFEAFFLLLSSIDGEVKHRNLIKKMHLFLTTGRFSNVRKIFQQSDKTAVQEFLLLATKCHSLTDHDIKILHSLAEVVHPSLKKLNQKYTKQIEDVPSIWTTQESYNKVKKRIETISTIETVQNAKEIERAREHGDLRENAEFKAALEKRDRLQQELKRLSTEIHQSRILRPEDVSTKEVGIGVIIDCHNDLGKPISYTLLGPWDADPDQNILSFQSKLAQSILGKSVGDKFTVQGEHLTIVSLRSYFESS